MILRARRTLPFCDFPGLFAATPVGVCGTQCGWHGCRQSRTLDGSVGAAEEEKGAHRAVHATGFHEEPSESFLKCELVTNGCVRNSGSSTVLVTISHVSPLGSESTL